MRPSRSWCPAVDWPKLSTAQLSSKRVLLRFDGDAPLRKMEDGRWKMADTNRLEASLPTIKYGLAHGAKVVLLCHMGRPSKVRNKTEAIKNGKNGSTKMLVAFFEARLGQKVAFFDDFRCPPDTDVSLFENLRFWPGEEANDSTFAKQLASLGDIFVDDAMAVLHRDQASVTELPRLLPHYIGLHLEEELRFLDRLRGEVDRPYTVIVGGAKVSDKGPLLDDLAGRADRVLIGGLVAVTYLVAMGQPVGGHVVEAEDIRLAQHAIVRMHRHGTRFSVPEDFVTQDRAVKAVTAWGKNDRMLDIGPSTREQFVKIIDKSSTLFWNGAFGQFENPAFAAGTLTIARAIAYTDADVKIAAGGDTVSAIHQFKLANGFTFISTGGGATLEYIAGRQLPGLTALVA